MNRIASDLDLSFCISHSLDQIAIGKYDLQLNFGSGVTLAVQSEAELLKGGTVVGTWTEAGGWSSLAYAALLNDTVTHAHIPDERTIELQFSDGLVLRLYDNSDQFESMQIFGPGRDLVVI